MSEHVIKSLRDVILLQAEWHGKNAARLEVRAKDALLPGLIKALKKDATESRAMAEQLRLAVAASEKAEVL